MTEKKVKDRPITRKDYALGLRISSVYKEKLEAFAIKDGDSSLSHAARKIIYSALDNQ